MGDKFWEQYQDPRWQERRLRIMERAGFKCEECGDAGTTLNVHHGYYVKGAAPWEYPNEALKCWCEPCHKNFHEKKRALEKLLLVLTFVQIDKLIRYAISLLARPVPAVAPTGERAEILAELETMPKHERALELLARLQRLS
jgi:hypothetical protein